MRLRSRPAVAILLTLGLAALRKGELVYRTQQLTFTVNPP
jgi:hypothetical protein